MQTTPAKRDHGRGFVRQPSRDAGCGFDLKIGLVTGLAALALAAWATDCTAQTAPVDGTEATQRTLDQKRNELVEKDRKARELQGDVVELDAERERLNTRLVETAALIQRSEAQMTSIEGRLSELEAQEKVVRGSLDQRYGQITKLLGALQRMGRNPPPVLITRREDALKMVRSAMLLSSAFPELKGQALELAGKLDDLVRVKTNIRSEGERLQAETDRLSDARTRLASLMDAKKLTIADRQSELAAVRAASAQISQNVADLSDLISRLDKTVTEKTGLGAYDRKLKEAAASQTQPVETASANSIPASTPVQPAVALATEPAGEIDAKKETQVATIMPPKLKPQIAELAPSTTALMPGSPARITPAIPFATARAKLPAPAQGRRVLAFGERTQFGGQSKGIVIETRNSAQVTAPCDGWVVYAGEFRSYGQLLIINAGDGYHVLLAGMSQIDVQPGQFVLTAEPVGTMTGGQKNSTTAPAPGNAPVLYVEFRKDGRPIDPDPWWVSGQQKVQG